MWPMSSPVMIIGVLGMLEMEVRMEVWAFSYDMMLMSYVLASIS